MITPADDDETLDPAESSNCDDANDRYLPARMINEAVYCPRLFYLMHVEGQFAHNAETVDGESVHRRVDKRQMHSQRPQKLPSLH